MSWVLFAFILLIINLCNALLSQQFKINGKTIAVWQSAIPVIVLAPIAFSVEWPTHPLFYLGCIGAATLSQLTVIRRLEGPKLYGARAISSLMPLTVVISFILWFVVNEAYRAEFLSDPLRVGLSIIVMGAILYSVYRIKNKSNVSFSALMYIAPILLSSSIVAILNKTAMDNSALISGIVIYGWLQSIYMLSLRLYQNKAEGICSKTYITPQTIKLGLAFGVSGIFLMATKNAAMALAPNPAYVLLVVLLQPFATDIANKFLNYTDTSDKVSGSIIVASVMVLVVATKML